MEDMEVKRAFWKDKKVFITGHTGFKGGWLSLWLADMGAEVYGYALQPPTEPNFFTVNKLCSKICGSKIFDIRDADSLQKAIQSVQPEIVFHLAAQPLVRYSYVAPVDTYAVNVIGTVNLLEAVRKVTSVKAVVNVTTDKCYDNREWIWPYREIDALGGFDPYSSSKACSEIVTAAYRSSFLDPSGIYVATARAGNVIGGGDWAKDRLIPDFLRSIDNGNTLTIRSPQAMRPWQHVLEPLSGYLMLAQALYDNGPKYASAWNFGPDEADMRPVQWIVDYLCSNVPDASWQCFESRQLHEANILKLDSSKTKSQLGWRPRWNLQKALGMTLAWHHVWRKGGDLARTSLEQIECYESDKYQL